MFTYFLGLCGIVFFVGGVLCIAYAIVRLP